MPSDDSHRRHIIALSRRRHAAVVLCITPLRLTQIAVAVTAQSARTDCRISAGHAHEPEHAVRGGTAKHQMLWRQLNLSGPRL